LLIIDEGKAKRSIPPNIQRIVVTSDFSTGNEDALTYGLSLGQDAHANLVFLHVVPPIPLSVSPQLLPAVESQQAPEQARKELENSLPADARERCSVEIRVENGEPYREILNVVKEIRADLLIMNIHGKGGLERALLGSTAERVIRGATCPVMAIPPLKKARRAA
jgi:nucleotide-binding universal stress UspA family protein